MDLTIPRVGTNGELGFIAFLSFSFTLQAQHYLHNVVDAGRTGHCAAPTADAPGYSIGIVESMQLMAIPELQALGRGGSKVEVTGHHRKAVKLATIPFALPFS